MNKTDKTFKTLLFSCVLSVLNVLFFLFFFFVFVFYMNKTDKTFKTLLFSGVLSVLNVLFFLSSFSFLSSLYRCKVTYFSLILQEKRLEFAVSLVSFHFQNIHRLWFHLHGALTIALPCVLHKQMQSVLLLPQFGVV